MPRRTKPPIPIIKDNYALIELTRGYYAIIDLDDVERVSKYVWSAQVKKHLKYAVTSRKNGKPGQMFLHQFIMGFPGHDIDHENGDGLDNRKSNLRHVNDKQNQANQRVRKNGTSKYKGVFKATQGGNWRASIMHDGASRYIGSYLSEEAAAEAYNKAAIKLRGRYALINTIEKSK